MAANAPNARLSLSCLPSEIIVAIHEALPNFHTLITVALTCRRFHHLALCSDYDVAQTVMSNQMDPRVLRYATAAVAARRSEEWLRSQPPNQRILKMDSSQSAPYSDRSLDLGTLRELDQLHVVVTKLATEFIDSAFSKFAEYNVNTSPVSRVERSRIESALFRVETLCSVLKMRGCANQFLECSTESIAAAGLVYLRCAASWENEQLYCLWDWLSAGARAALHRMCSQNLDWANHFSVFHEGVIHQYRLDQEVLKGLRHISALLEAASTSELQGLLGSPRNPPVSGIANGDRSIWLDDAQSLAAENYTVLDHAIRLERSFGPGQMWAWSKRLTEDGYDMCVPTEKSLRGWGWVFWDHGRVETVVAREAHWIARDSPKWVGMIRERGAQEDAEHKNESLLFRNYRLALGQDSNLGWGGVVETLDEPERERAAQLKDYLSEMGRTPSLTYWTARMPVLNEDDSDL